MKCYFSNLIGMRSKLSKHEEIATTWEFPAAIPLCYCGDASHETQIVFFIFTFPGTINLENQETIFEALDSSANLGSWGEYDNHWTTEVDTDGTDI